MGELFVVAVSVFWWVFYLWAYKKLYKKTWSSDFVAMVKMFGKWFKNERRFQEDT
jgi:hypothetical protein